MTRARLDMAQEGELWEMALEHLGSDGLLQAVIETAPGAHPDQSLSIYPTTRLAKKS